jgi:transposase
MRGNDARTQSLAALHERRKQVIRLHRKQYGVTQIVELTGLSWPAVRTAIDLYEAGGMTALRTEPRGKKSGEGPPSQSRSRGSELIVEKRPGQLKIAFALWTRAAAGQLIEAEFQIKLPAPRVGEYLKRWGFTAQKPIRRAYEQSPEAVEYPAIAAKAKAEGGEIQLERRGGAGQDP